MRVEINLGIGEHGRELLDFVGRTAFGELVGEILRVEIGEVHGVGERV